MTELKQCKWIFDWDEPRKDCGRELRHEGAHKSMTHEVKREIVMPNGGSVTVTVSSSEPIEEKDYMILRPQAAIEMSNCLMDLAEAMKGTK